MKSSFLISNVLLLGITLFAHSVFSAPISFFDQDTISKPIPITDTIINTKDTVSVKKDSAKKKPDIKAYDEVITKEAQSKRGLFTVHKVNNKWFFELPDSIFNRDVLVVTRYSKVAAGAGVYGGEMANQQVVQFERGPDKNIFLTLVTSISVADSADQIYKAVKLSNNNPLIAAFPIQTYGHKTTVIDVTAFLNGDNVPVSISARRKKNINLNSIVADRSYIKNINAYPINVEVKTVKTFTATARTDAPNTPSQPGSFFDVASDAGVVTLELNNSFLLLPKIPAKRRLNDPRVGYYANRYTLFSDSQQNVDEQTFIVRWNLEPRAQDFEKWRKGGLVEPQKPIVFYIDPATPSKWVPYLIRGVNDWQKAFEKAGFKNAIYAKEWPKNDTTMSLEDARFSVIRYFASDIENAYGPNVHDPRSGQILESHVGWYHNVMRILRDWYFVQAGAVDKRAQKMVFDDALMGELVRFVSSHEIGHTLGLRHNFGSSSTVPVEKLRDKKWVETHGHTPSIMDYARFNYVAQPEDNISQKGLFPRIGEYDEWAIQWGYSYSGARDAKEDKKITNKWIIENLKKNPRLWFGTETNPYDPRSQAEDLGNDNMLASDYGIKNLKVILANLKNWTKEEADLYTNLSHIDDQILTQYGRYMYHVLKNVGGVEETPKSVEQEGSVYKPTTKETQKRALGFLHHQLFETPYWLMDNKIQDMINNPVDDNRVSNIQMSVLNALMSGSRLHRININEARYASENPYSVLELLTDIEMELLKELDLGAKVDLYRRNLQKQYVSNLIRMSSTETNQIGGTSLSYSNTDLPTIAKGRLIDLKLKIDAKASAIADDMTRYHFLDLASRIEQALQPNKMR